MSVNLARSPHSDSLCSRRIPCLPGPITNSPETQHSIYFLSFGPSSWSLCSLSCLHSATFSLILQASIVHETSVLILTELFTEPQTFTFCQFFFKNFNKFLSDIPSKHHRPIHKCYRPRSCRKKNVSHKHACTHTHTHAHTCMHTLALAHTLAHTDTTFITELWISCTYLPTKILILSYSLLSHFFLHGTLPSRQMVGKCH